MNMKGIMCLVYEVEKNEENTASWRRPKLNKRTRKMVGKRPYIVLKIFGTNLAQKKSNGFSITNVHAVGTHLSPSP